MTILLVMILSFLLGCFLFPALLFLRARRSDRWDKSNIFNIYRVVAYLAIHPEKFGELTDANGEKPFWYISKDEFSDIV